MENDEEEISVDQYKYAICEFRATPCYKRIRLILVSLAVIFTGLSWFLYGTHYQFCLGPIPVCMFKISLIVATLSGALFFNHTLLTRIKCSLLDMFRIPDYPPFKIEKRGYRTAFPPMILGYLETTLYPMLFLIEMPGFIPFWLGLKYAAGLQRWTGNNSGQKDKKELDENEDKGYEKSARFNLNLILNLLQLFLGFGTYKIIQVFSIF